ncbi:stage II sporulation protein M [Ensifer sp. ENS06]|uniref:stage II sporulation protein M n=1 Tax=Ensifer sp. ENS06 TaxID=2769276 RepID=UPI0013AF2508|nr:stage II sporulation protein M [Ensifer sp. ENS06]MBD9626345.1 stage II sporulation protein M [Ensifer sp. ENS06]
MTLLAGAFSIIKRHRRAFIGLNAVFYGLFALSMAVTVLVPDIQSYFKGDIDQAYMQPGIFKTVGDAYASKNLPVAIGLTFTVNLIVAFAMTTLPSLIIPFVGILATLHRALLWGVMFAPIGPYSATLIPHSITLLIEGQAYVLAAFGAYVHGRAFLQISHYRLSARWEAWKAGAHLVARLYILVIVALLVGAIYEVFSAIYVMPYLV